MSEEKKAQYLGPKKIRSTKLNKEDDTELFVTFKDNTKVAIKQKLFDLMVSGVKTESADDNSFTSAMYYFIAKKVLTDLADYGLEQYQVKSVATHIGTLIHNLTEAKIGEVFNCDGTERISLADIIK